MAFNIKKKRPFAKGKEAFISWSLRQAQCYRGHGWESSWAAIATVSRVDDERTVAMAASI